MEIWMDRELRQKWVEAWVEINGGKEISSRFSDWLHMCAVSDSGRMPLSM
jgi:hypothetical protein